MYQKDHKSKCHISGMNVNYCKELGKDCHNCRLANYQRDNLKSLLIKKEYNKEVINGRYQSNY